jgi:cyclopropane fatty-acyl-phospholipid synthase-like methyltransferase
MTADPKKLVAAGYDRIADAYLDRFGISAVRQKWFDRLVACLPRDGRILDLGCGAGVPVARDLTSLGHSVVGVDGSTQQIARARRNVPDAMFIEADMCEVQFDADAFDAVAAFYSITHVPAAEQGGLFVKIAKWLKPDGVMVASLGSGPASDWTGDWLGTTMFSSSNSTETSHAHLREAGLIVRESGVEHQDNEDAEFLWVLAAKIPLRPPEPASRRR